MRDHRVAARVYVRFVCVCDRACCECVHKNAAYRTASAAPSFWPLSSSTPPRLIYSRANTHSYTRNVRTRDGARTPHQTFTLGHTGADTHKARHIGGGGGGGGSGGNDSVSLAVPMMLPPYSMCVNNCAAISLYARAHGDDDGDRCSDRFDDEKTRNTTRSNTKNTTACIGVPARTERERSERVVPTTTTAVGKVSEVVETDAVVRVTRA